MIWYVSPLLNFTSPNSTKPNSFPFFNFYSIWQKKRKKKMRMKAVDDSHVRELSFATLAAFSRKATSWKVHIKYHSILTFIILYQKKITKFVSFIYFIFHLGFVFQLSPNINICVTWLYQLELHSFLLNWYGYIIYCKD